MVEVTRYKPTSIGPCGVGNELQADKHRPKWCASQYGESDKCKPIWEITWYRTVFRWILHGNSVGP